MAKQPYTDPVVAASEAVASATQQLLNTIEPNPFLEVRVTTSQSGSMAIVALYDKDKLEYVHTVTVAL